MRITGGDFRGRRLKPPKGMAVRPSADRVREALFHILGDVSELKVVDLFCGTGSLGIEALSRGAAHCLFVDASAQSLALTRHNLGALGLEPVSDTLRGDVLKLLDGGRLGEGHHLIFLDPPYRKGLADGALGRIGGGEVLRSGGVVVAEVDHRDPLESTYGHLELDDSRLYGSTRINIYIRP